jgi:hypothetical protein
MNNIPEKSSLTIDEIIKKWFPIIGIIFIVSGVSYLFYNGIWDKINPPGRMTFGFIIGVMFIAGGYSFEKRLKNFADAIIGGGILIIYSALIYGSRFGVTQDQPIISELPTLLIAVAFSAGLAYYSYTRKSNYLLILGMIGGYLTPFLLGESGEFFEYVQGDNGQEVVFTSHSLPFIAYLIYFCAVNAAYFLVANKRFLKGLGLVNSLALFVSTVVLAEFTTENFSDNTLAISVASLVIVALHLSGMAINARKFEKEEDPYLLAGYLLPFVWFIVIVKSFLVGELTDIQSALMFALVSVFYFSAWYYLKSVTHSNRNFALYIGGILSLVLTFTSIEALFHHYDSLVLSGISIIFAVLYVIKPLLQRQISFLFFASAGFLFTIANFADNPFKNLGPISSETLLVSASLLPFLLAYAFKKKPEEPSELITFRKITTNLAAIFIVLLFARDLFSIEEIPKDYVFFTIPALITALISVKKEENKSKLQLIKASTALAALGFITTLFICIQRFYPAPEDLRPFITPEFLIGFTTIVVYWILKKQVAKIPQGEGDSQLSAELNFFISFGLYIALWAIVTHEILALFSISSLDFADPKIQGIRALFVSLWWVALASWMIVMGTHNKSQYLNDKYLGFALLAFSILKVIFYDLRNIGTDLKTFLFIIIGVLILAVSYFANIKDKKGKDVDEIINKQ